MTSRPSPQPMTASEYREACKQLGFFPTDGEPIGKSGATAKRYSSGAAEIDATVVLLLRALLRVQEFEAELARMRQAAE